MKNKVARMAIAVLFAAGLMVSMSAFAQAEEHGCSLARAAGKWSFTDNGTVIGVGPRTAVGILTLDGKGNVLNGVATSSLNGAIADETFSGTYTVNPDCTGSVVRTDGSHFSFVVTPDGSRLDSIRTDPGTVFSGTAIRMTRRLEDD